MGGGQAHQRTDESKDSRPAPEECDMSKYAKAIFDYVVTVPLEGR